MEDAELGKRHMPRGNENHISGAGVMLPGGSELCRSIARSRMASCPYLRWMFARFVTMEATLRSWSSGYPRLERECTRILRDNGHTPQSRELDELLAHCRGESSTRCRRGAIPTLLLVDDDVLLLRSLTRLLRLRHRVFHAVSPERALLTLKTRRVDVVVSDFDMPGGPDGLAFLRKVRVRYPRVRRALMSGKPTIHFHAALESHLVETFLRTSGNTGDLASDIARMAAFDPNEAT